MAYSACDIHPKYSKKSGQHNSLCVQFSPNTPRRQSEIGHVTHVCPRVGGLTCLGANILIKYPVNNNSYSRQQQPTHPTSNTQHIIQQHT